MSLICSVYIATSLDGFIARENGDIDWLNAASAAAPQSEDCGYQAFMDSVDVLIMGRLTYEQVLTFGQWPYRKPVIVLSRNPLRIPTDLAGQGVSSSSETPPQLHHHLTQEGLTRAYIDGGTTVQRFLDAGLIDDITITTIPIVLGKGIPLFGPVDNDIHLEHVSTTGYDFGFVQSVYKVLGSTPNST